MLKKILNKKEAMEYLGISRYAIDVAIKSDSLRYKTVGHRLMFPVWALDEWLKNTIKHTDCISTSSGSIKSTSHLSTPKEEAYSLEKLLAAATCQKLNNMPLTAFTKSRKKRKMQTDCSA